MSQSVKFCSAMLTKLIILKTSFSVMYLARQSQSLFSKRFTCVKRSWDVIFIQLKFLESWHDIQDIWNCLQRIRKQNKFFDCAQTRKSIWLHSRNLVSCEVQFCYMNQAFKSPGGDGRDQIVGEEHNGGTCLKNIPHTLVLVSYFPAINHISQQRHNFV